MPGALPYLPVGSCVESVQDLNHLLIFAAVRLKTTIISTLETVSMISSCKMLYVNLCDKQNSVVATVGNHQTHILRHLPLVICAGGMDFLSETCETRVRRQRDGDSVWLDFHLQYFSAPVF